MLLSVLERPFWSHIVFGEPPRTQFDLNFSLLGIPVRIHPMFWLVAVLLGPKRQDPATLLTWVVAVFIAILVHEMGHAVVARTYRYRPWIVLYTAGGLTCYDPGHDSRSPGSAAAAANRH